MKNNRWLLLLFALLGLSLATPSAYVFADDEDEEEFEEDDSDEEESEDEDDSSSEPAATPSITSSATTSSTTSSAAPTYSTEKSSVDLSAYESGINSNDIFKLNAITSDAFKKMTTIERENAMTKLQIEREKLSFDLERQRAEKRKVELSLQSEEATAKRQEEDDDAFREEERRRRQEADDKRAAETARRKQEEELNRKILEKVASVDMSDPDQIASMAQLLALAPGSGAGLRSADGNSMLGGLLSANSGGGGKKDEVKDADSFEDKYVIKSIVGAGGQFSANIENPLKKTILRVKKGANIEGWTISGITATSVLLNKDGESKIMYLNQ